MWAKAKFTTMLKNNVVRMSRINCTVVEHAFKKVLAGTKKAIVRLDVQIAETIAQDSTLAHKKQLALTVTGVDQKMSHEEVAATHCFTRFEDPREMVCYIGAAPF